MQSSGNDIENKRIYSQKKKKPTINTLAVISPSGRILYLSPSYPGSVNDREIVEKTAASWYADLTEEENGLGDPGFRGMRGRIST